MDHDNDSEAPFEGKNHVRYFHDMVMVTNYVFLFACQIMWNARVNIPKIKYFLVSKFPNNVI